MESQTTPKRVARVQINKVHPKVLAEAKFSPSRAPGLTKLLSRLQKLRSELSKVGLEISGACTHAESDLAYEGKHGVSPHHCRTFTHNHKLICKVCGATLAGYDFED